MMAVAALLSCGKANFTPVEQGNGSVDSDVVMGDDSERVTQGSWMRLFMGMDLVKDEKAEDGFHYRYDCRLPELEGVDGVARQELEATWYHNDDDYPRRFRCTMGLYVDKDFPSNEIFNQVERGVDTLLTQSFYYDEELNDLKALLAKRQGYEPRGTQDILDRAKSVFDQFTHLMRPAKSVSDYTKCPESRICIVAHKIYDRGDWASYILEFSFSYNGSNGCPSWADYITVNKKTGKRLTINDLGEKYGYMSVSKELRNAFVKAKQERDAELELHNFSGGELLGLASGCAIVNEGVMVYYRPYIVGCGAEGEFNLILDHQWP